jgi:hypothetical protein
MASKKVALIVHFNEDLMTLGEFMQQAGSQLYNIIAVEKVDIQAQHQIKKPTELQLIAAKQKLLQSN